MYGIAGLEALHRHRDVCRNILSRERRSEIWRLYNNIATRGHATRGLQFSAELSLFLQFYYLIDCLWIGQIEAGQRKGRGPAVVFVRWPVKRLRAGIRIDW